MALYNIGGVRCQLRPFNVDQADDESEMPFARHKILGARTSHEKTAEVERKLSLEGSIFPRRAELDGRPELSLLESIQAAGQPILVLRGNSKLGWFVITRLRQEHSYLDPDGYGRKVRVSIDLEATQKSGNRSVAADIVTRLTGYV
jgi:phage protein U